MSKFTKQLNKTLQREENLNQSQSAVKHDGLSAKGAYSRMLPPLSPAPRSHAEVITSSHNLAAMQIMQNPSYGGHQGGIGTQTGGLDKHG